MPGGTSATLLVCTWDKMSGQARSVVMLICFHSWVLMVCHGKFHHQLYMHECTCMNLNSFLNRKDIWVLSFAPPKYHNNVCLPAVSLKLSQMSWLMISAPIQSCNWVPEGLGKLLSWTQLFFEWPNFKCWREKRVWAIWALPRRHGHSSFNDCSVRSLAKTLNDHTGDRLAVKAMAGGSGHKKECQSSQSPDSDIPHLSCCQLLGALKGRLFSISAHRQSKHKIWLQLSHGHEQPTDN